MRTILLERGDAGPSQLEERLQKILWDAHNGLVPRAHELVAELPVARRQLDRRILTGDEEPLAEALGTHACRRLPKVPRLGAQTTTAMVAVIGSGNAFDRSRGLAAKLGLTPRENSLGSKRRLGNIAKRGNRFL